MDGFERYLGKFDRIWWLTECEDNSQVSDISQGERKKVEVYEFEEIECCLRDLLVELPTEQLFIKVWCLREKSDVEEI